MIEIWGRRNSNNVMAVMWTAGELHIPFHRYDVGGSFGGLDSEAFLAMNPNGRIPVMKHEGKYLYESTTIVRYLTAVFGKGTLCAADPYGKAITDQWMDWFKSTFYPAFHPLFWGLIRTPMAQRNNQLVSDSALKTGDVLRVAEQRLQSCDYLGGEDFSIADIPLGACIYRYFHLDIARPHLPALEDWYRRLTLRTEYQKHVMIPFGSNHTEWLELEKAAAKNAFKPS